MKAGPNPSGICQCGCGLLAPIAPQTHQRKGWITGQPLRFINGHAGRSKRPLPDDLDHRGLCFCGCGQTTRIADRTFARLGIIKGYPVRYVRGHWGKRPATLYKVDPDTGCWNWTRGGSQGYGYISSGVAAHRVAYENVHGPIPTGHIVHHTCGNRACVNPDHLVPLTRSKHARLHRTQGAN
jgi:hypothetical protein